MQTGPLNPYNYLSAVQDPHMFYGRNHTLRRIYSAILTAQSIAVIGSRQAGKSSLLYCIRLPQVQARFEYDLSHHLTILIDLREYLHKTKSDFFEAVSKQICAQSRLPLQLPAPGPSGEDIFSQLLDQIKEQQYHTVLLMDAFDNVTRNTHFDFGFFGFLRSQATLGKVSYITASLAPLDKVCHQEIKESPFFNIFGNCELEALAQDDARLLVSEPAQKAGLPFTEEEVNWVLKQAGRHPFFLQRTCYYLFDEKREHSGVPPDLARVKKQVYKEMRPRFVNIWEDLSQEEQERLKIEAQHKGLQERDYLPELSESQLFRLFVRDMYGLHVYQLTVEALEEALEEMDDVRALGDTELRHMNIVSQRLKKVGIASGAERGIAIRDVLNEAFERMKNNGSARKDTAPEWRHYNILYYRYFKNRLKHDQIAARLEFSSTRQYFRERTKAVATLLNILIEMEVSAQEDE